MKTWCCRDWCVIAYYSGIFIVGNQKHVEYSILFYTFYTCVGKMQHYVYRMVKMFSLFGIFVCPVSTDVKLFDRSKYDYIFEHSGHCAQCNTVDSGHCTFLTYILR